MKPDGEEGRAFVLRWVPELGAAGPKAAPPEARDLFAVAVISKLGDAFERGQRAQKAYQIRHDFKASIMNAQLALGRLGDKIILDPISASKEGLTSEGFEAVFRPLVEYLVSDLDGCEEETWEQRSFLKPGPGRNNLKAIEIADMIAREYDRHFGNPPGRSKQGYKEPDLAPNNPFFRICKVVELILVDGGYGKVSIGDDARREGIDRACTAILKEMLGMGPSDICVWGDPRTRLLAKRNGEGSRQPEPVIVEDA